LTGAIDAVCDGGYRLNRKPKIECGEGASVFPHRLAF
jgi:hypothetical protein